MNTKEIEITTSTPYTPESNGLTERVHIVLISSLRSCLKQSKLPLPYWNYALRHVTNCQNLLPHSTTKTPYEIVHGNTSLEIIHLTPFGCRVEFFTMTKNIGTFSPRTENGIDLYHEGGGVYKFETSTWTIQTKHVTFFE